MPSSRPATLAFRLATMTATLLTLIVSAPAAQAPASATALLVAGHYEEAEVEAERAFRAASTPSFDTAGDVLIEALLLNGRGSEAPTRDSPNGSSTRAVPPAFLGNSSPPACVISAMCCFTSATTPRRRPRFETR